MFKIKENGDYYEFNHKNMINKLNDIGFNPQKSNKNDRNDYIEDRLLNFYILSGCDYFKYKGIGSARSFKLCQKYNTEELKKEVFKNDEKTIYSFNQAKCAFNHNMIYCPLDCINKFLNEDKIDYNNEYQINILKSINNDLILTHNEINNLMQVKDIDTFTLQQPGCDLWSTISEGCLDDIIVTTIN